MGSTSRRISFTWQLVAAMGLGVAVGLIFGPKAAPVGEVGRLIIQAVKTFATPLLFFSILYAVMTTRIEGKHVGRMLSVSFLNAAIALSIGLILSNVFRVGERLAGLFASASATTAAAATAVPKIEFGRFLSTFVPTSVLQPFVDNIAVSIILLALLLGFALRSLKSDPTLTPIIESAERAARVSLRVTEVVLTWIVKLIPIAVFSVVVQTVGKAGVEGLHNLGYYVLLGLGGLAIHVIVTHHAWLLYLRRPVGEFWRAAREPVIHALGTNSSLATLPLTLKALDRLKVSRPSATLGACVGTNFNNDGILLYEAMAALMVAQAVGIHLSFAAQVTIHRIDPVIGRGPQAQPFPRDIMARQLGLVSVIDAHMAIAVEIQFAVLLVGDPLLGQFAIPFHRLSQIPAQELELGAQRPHFRNAVQPQNFSPLARRLITQLVPRIESGPEP